MSKVTSGQTFDLYSVYLIKQKLFYCHLLHIKETFLSKLIFQMNKASTL